MAFCKYCGTQLADGAVCQCPQAQAELQTQAQQPAPQEPVYQQPVYQQPAPQEPTYQQPAYQQPVYQQPAPAPQKPNQFVTALTDIWQLILNMIKKPVTAAADFVKTGTQIHCFIMMGAQALLVALLVTLLAAKYNGIFESAMKISSFGMGSSALAAQLRQVTFSVPLVFVLSFMITAGIAFLIPALLMLIVKLFKGNTDYNTMLKVSAVNSLIAVPFVLLGVLISIILPVNIGVSGLGDSSSMLGGLVSAFSIPVIVACLGMTVGSFTMMALVPQVSEVNQEFLPVTMFLVWLGTTIAFYIAFALIGWPLCAPPILKML